MPRNSRMTSASTTPTRLPARRTRRTRWPGRACASSARSTRRGSREYTDTEDERRAAARDAPEAGRWRFPMASVTAARRLAPEPRHTSRAQRALSRARRPRRASTRRRRTSESCRAARHSSPLCAVGAKCKRAAAIGIRGKCRIFGGKARARLPRRLSAIRLVTDVRHIRGRPTRAISRCCAGPRRRRSSSP